MMNHGKLLSRMKTRALYITMVTLTNNIHGDHLITALFSLSPIYVTTYKSGAQNSNSRSQLTIVDKGALIRKGPLV